MPRLRESLPERLLWTRFQRWRRRRMILRIQRHERQAVALYGRIQAISRDLDAR